MHEKSCKGIYQYLCMMRLCVIFVSLHFLYCFCFLQWAESTRGQWINTLDYTKQNLGFVWIDQFRCTLRIQSISSTTCRSPWLKLNLEKNVGTKEHKQEKYKITWATLWLRGKHQGFKMPTFHFQQSPTVPPDLPTLVRDSWGSSCWCSAFILMSHSWNIWKETGNFFDPWEIPFLRKERFCQLDQHFKCLASAFRWKEQCAVFNCETHHPNHTLREPLWGTDLCNVFVNTVFLECRYSQYFEQDLVITYSW